MGSLKVHVTAWYVSGSAFGLSNFDDGMTVQVSFNFLTYGISGGYFVIAPMSAVSSAVAAMQPSVSSFGPAGSFAFPMRRIPTWRTDFAGRVSLKVMELHVGSTTGVGTPFGALGGGKLIPSGSQLVSLTAHTASFGVHSSKVGKIGHLSLV